MPAVTVLHSLGGGHEVQKSPDGRSEIKEICTCAKVAVAGKDELEYVSL